jgi:PHD/YefM family antitoxin component YafN of YafNO toxin-antitoxin module
MEHLLLGDLHELVIPATDYPHHLLAQALCLPTLERERRVQVLADDEVLDAVRESEEPYVVLQRSQKAAYLVDADVYDAQMAELRSARRQLFLREVGEAEAELRAGKGAEYDNVEDLIKALGSKSPK